jgi:mannose-6-phosphate isomerase-like protein (cupin superfamily)
MYKVNIDKRTRSNRSFRKVLHDTPQARLTIMSVKTEIPEEKHNNVTQFIRVEEGTGVITIDGRSVRVKDGDAVIIPPGAVHTVKCTSKIPLKLYSVYSVFKNVPKP